MFGERKNLVVKSFFAKTDPKSNFLHNNIKSFGEAMQWLSSGAGPLFAVLSNSDVYAFSVEIIAIKNLSGDQYSVSTRSGHTYTVNGFERKVITMHVRGFIDEDANELYCENGVALSKLAIENGHKVRATNLMQKTDPIKRFLSQNTFETDSGNIYQML